MNELINQYSALWIAGAFLLLTSLILFRDKPKGRDFIAFGVVLVGLFIAWVLLRPTQTPLMEDSKSVQEMIGQGKPVLLEFQSPY